MPIITFLFMNSIVTISAFLITYRLFKFFNFSDSLLCWFIISFTQIILSELILGIFSLLTLKNIILLNLAILLITWLITRNKGSSFNFTAAREALNTVLANKPALLCISIISGFTLVKIFVNLINPPFGWDDLNYHFTFPVEWIKNANLNNPLVINDDPFPTYYPFNGSLLFLWLILPFKSAFLADLGQLPFFIVSFLAILGIGQKLKLNREYSFFAACLFVFIPNFFKQLQIAYVDIMVAALFFTALNFLFCLLEKYDFKNVFLFSLAAAGFIGIKTTAIPYSIFLLAPFFYITLSEKQICPPVKFRYSLLLFALLFIFGCFSYFRNFLLTQNPFYPLNIPIMGKTIFKGVIDKATFTARNIQTDYSLAKILFHEGLGIQSLLVILPGTILAFFLGIFRYKRKDLFLHYIMLLPMLLYLTYRFILPIPNSRYLYPMLGIGMIIGFYILQNIKIPLKAVRIISLIFIIASAFECARRRELYISLVLASFLFLIFTLLSRYKRLRTVLFSKGIIFLAALLFLAILQLCFSDYRKNEYIRYVKNSRYWPDATKAWLWLNNNTEDNNIAYVGKPVPYPLYGTDFKNNVYYVSVNSIDPIHLHDLKNSAYSWNSNAINMHKSFEQPDNYRGNANYSVWLNNLHKRKTEYLFIYSLHHTKDVRFPIEETWAKAHPDKFNLTFNNDSIRIYKLKK